MEVVTDPQRLEPGPLGHPGLLHQLGGRELLARQEVAVGRHAPGVPCACAVMPALSPTWALPFPRPEGWCGTALPACSMEGRRQMSLRRSPHRLGSCRWAWE